MPNNPFPNLQDDDNFEVTSPFDPNYNCIAWAIGDNENFWWPSKYSYWPENIPHEVTLEAFIELYKNLGYEICEDSQYEEEYKKIAIYVDSSDKPTHAAKQIREDVWSSKCGKAEDIEHSLEAVEGNLYGTVACIMRKEVEKKE